MRPYSMSEISSRLTNSRRRRPRSRSAGRNLAAAVLLALLALALVRDARAADVSVMASASGVPDVVGRDLTRADATNVGSPGQTLSQATAFFEDNGPHLRVFATSDMSSRGGNAAQGLARFNDELVINSPSRPGQPGFYAATFRLSGSMAQHGNAGSHANDRATSIAGLTMQVAETEETFGYQEQLTGEIPDIITTGDNFLNTDLTVLGRIVFGRPFLLSGQIAARTGVVIGADGSSMDATSDLSHSFEWLGYSIADELGNPVTDFQLVSQSGSTYAGVPEPAAIWLAVVCGMSLWARARNRRPQSMAQCHTSPEPRRVLQNQDRIFRARRYPASIAANSPFSKFSIRGSAAPFRTGL